MAPTERGSARGAAAALAALPPERRTRARGIEVGHIFYFETEYSEAMGARVAGPDGEPVAVETGSCGIGVSRPVGAIIEASHDEAGIIWPESVAPFRTAPVDLEQDGADCARVCEELAARRSCRPARPRGGHYARPTPRLRERRRPACVRPPPGRR